MAEKPEAENEPPKDKLAASVDECKLSDAGKYGFAGLAANIIAGLYNKDEEREFRHKFLDNLMASIELTEGARASQLAVADGEYETEPEPFIDMLLEEPLVKESSEALLTSLLLLAIKDGNYDARVRVIVSHMSWLLRADMKSVEVIEEHLVEVLKNQGELSAEEKKAAAKKSRNNKIKRGVLIGLATVVGGTVIGLTGGLAAPLIATGVGAVIGTAGGAALGSVAGVAVIGSLFGVAGAGLTGYKMKKRVGGVEQFEFDVLTEGSQMTVTIAVSGWIGKSGNEDFRTPWLPLDNSKEQYYLKYEGQYLRELGQSMETLSNLVIKQAITESLKYTALSTLLAAIAWPSTLLGLASIIDNPWHVCTKRAENAGKHLAEVLVNRQQGQRPVTLIGFSLGARVIFFCLKELAKHPRGAGIVEDAYLLGAPVSGSTSDWEPFSKVIAGKIVNAYIRNDWMLKFLYRTASVQLKIAGIGPVMWEDRRMINMDLTNVVNGHMDYMKKMATVLEAVGINTREVKTNVFMSHSDSGYSSKSPTASSTKEDLSMLVKKTESAESLPSAQFPPLLEIGATEEFKDAELPATNEILEPYTKLGIKESSDDGLDSLSKDKHHPLVDGDTTESDKSLADKLTYEQLVDKGSSQDSVSMPDVKQKKKQPVKVIPVAKTIGSEKLLGDAAKDKLLNNESSDDSLLDKAAASSSQK